MPILNLYSHRKRLADEGIPDELVYYLPTKLRVQIAHIWREAIGPINVNTHGWKAIHNTVAKAHGVFSLSGGKSDGEQCLLFLLNETSVDDVLDLIEASFIYINTVARNLESILVEHYQITTPASDAIDELNGWFLRAGVGYRFDEGMIIRVHSELIHSEVVQPALRYLSEPGFEGPRDEFLKAHAHYRAGETKDAITDANNAFESTLKAVCKQRQWAYPRGARASDLLKIVRGNGLLPDYLDNSFDQLAATLKSGLPKVRDEEGAHGQGPTPRETPNHVAAYALHLAAAKILFIVESHKAMD